MLIIPSVHPSVVTFQKYNSNKWNNSKYNNVNICVFYMPYIIFKKFLMIFIPYNIPYSLMM